VDTVGLVFYDAFHIAEIRSIKWDTTRENNDEVGNSWRITL